MQKSTEETIIALNEQINELIYVAKNIQAKQAELEKTWNKRYGVVMKHFSKMQDFHELADMANQVFEKRLCNLEKAIYNEKW